MILLKLFVIISFINYAVSDIVDNLEIILPNIHGLLKSSELNNYVKESKINYNDKLCMKHYDEIVNGITNSDSWALKLIDSWGKIPSGIFWGHFTDLGHFEECVNVKNPKSKDLQPRYCLAKIPIDKILDNDNGNKFNSRIAASISSFDKNMTLGVCVPTSCSLTKTRNFIQKIIKKVFHIELEENAPFIAEETCSINEIIQFRPIDIVAITFFALIGILMILSTIYDYLIRKSNGSPILILIAFSVLTNGKKLFQIPIGNSSNFVRCLNGIRCLSIMWVVLGHTYMISAFRPQTNPTKIKDWFQSPASMFIQTAPISVDSFFFLSGFLISWVGFKEMEKSNGKINIFLMYFHRYIRLTPIVGVAILFCVSLLKYCGSGPLWNSFTVSSIKLCEDNWWSTILYVNNYVSAGKMCLGHTWYLSVDTQLYFLAPLILIPTYKWGKKFLLPATIILLILTIGCVFATTMNQNLSMLFTQSGSNSDVRLAKIYYPTHARYGTWLIGLVIGYLMFQHRNKRLILSKIVVVIGWLISLIIIFSIIFGPYANINPKNQPSKIQSAFYTSCGGISWSIALAWIVFACEKGYGGFVNSFLSYPFWQVFGRLTYSIYIIHMILQLIRYGSDKTDVHFSDYEIILNAISDFGLTTLISIVAVLAFESPIIGIEKAIFKNEKNKILQRKSLSQEYLTGINCEKMPSTGATRAIEVF